MGLFVMNMEETPTVKGLIKTALVNLSMYSQYVEMGTFTDDRGQTPPDYLVTAFAMKYLKDALEILEKEE